jgi:hypothetical protein
MNDSSAAFAVLLGMSLRLVVPILITVIIVLALTRLDRRWQTEARATQAKVAKPECWKLRGCPASSRNQCRAYKSDLACWQVFRLHNGYLDEKCLDCAVLRSAPAPA